MQTHAEAGRLRRVALLGGQDVQDASAAALPGLRALGDLGAQVRIQVFVPGRLRNPLNSRRTLRRAIAEGVDWKRKTRAAWLAANRPQWDGPAVMQLTAYTARLWDCHEGLGAALKHVRDEAVRLILDGNPPRRQDKNGDWYDAPANDGPESGHTFQPPNQIVRSNPRERGVLIAVEPLAGRDGPAGR